MINEDRWVNSLPKTNIKNEDKINELDHDRWINTIPKTKSYTSVKKYSLMTVLFVSGLLFVSALKNETRNLQKEINNLEASINVIKFNLKQAILDNEVITSPENISKLAEENLNHNTEKFTEIEKIEDKKTNDKKIQNLRASLKTHIGEKIKKNKTEIKKIKKLYKDPKSIPQEVKTGVSKQIEDKKTSLKNIYNSPKDVFTLEKVGRWGVVQVVKVFLGMPVVPGR